MTCVVAMVRGWCPWCAAEAARAQRERDARRAELVRAAARKAEADRQRSAVRWLAVGA